MAETNAPVTVEQLMDLRKQNELLQQQLHRQQEMIEDLTRKVGAMQASNAKHDEELDRLKVDIKTPEPEPAPNRGVHLGRVDISGEGALAFFHSEAKGPAPNSEFRIDEARLFIEAPIWKEVYFYTELDFATHENPGLYTEIGELYLDFQDVSQLWGRDGMLNLRAGRFYIPFGEEYLVRYAIDNPLISHSLGDLWGVDNGVEAYGKLGKVNYAVAVQNGSGQDLRDYNPDKSVAGRVGYDPTPWLHLSLSGMRTGDLNVQQDTLSAMWFGGGFFRSIGSTNTTVFRTDLVEADVQLRLPWVNLRAAGGYINYEDNDSSRDNHRNLYYYYVEGVRDITKKWYGAARFSQTLLPGGYPLVGGQTMGNFFNPGYPNTTDFWRLSMGLGYRFSPNLVVKGEYTFNEGRQVNGNDRRQESVLGLEAAFKF